LPLKGGSGPRHLAYHPNKNLAYIMTEFSSEVIVLTYHPENGHFTEKQYISTIPDDFNENNQGSAIHISSDGRFVYAGNRGHNSIAIFAVNEETGELSFVDRVSTEGDWPRDFVLDPTEKFIVASNQESNNLVIYARDTNSGKLKLLQSDIEVSMPVCVKFLNY
jgi:6-phosphogluconolactonase